MICLRTTILAAAFALGAAPAAFADSAAKSGTFTGASDHETTGGVEVVKTDHGYEVRLGEDFVHDGAPDPHIAFGNDGSFVKGTDFESLHENEGAQVYEVPASIDASEYDTVFIWCADYSAPLGVAKLD